MSPPAVRPGSRITRRRTSCPARTWVSSSARRWWGRLNWTPWRPSMTSDTRDWWWRRSLPMKMCCSERKGWKKSSGEMEEHVWKDEGRDCLRGLRAFLCNLSQSANLKMLNIDNDSWNSEPSEVKRNVATAHVGETLVLVFKRMPWNF